MNKKRLSLSILLVFIFIVAFEWVFHGVVMREMYMATANLWRPEAEMQKYFLWMLGGQYLLALMFCFIFTFGYQARGWMEGARYGFYIALLLSSYTIVMFAVEPYPSKIVIYWLVGRFAELILAGILLASVYRK